MHRQTQMARKKNEEVRLEALSALSNEVRDAYLEVTRTHRRLLARLAQR